MHFIKFDFINVYALYVNKQCRLSNLSIAGLHVTIVNEQLRCDEGTSLSNS